MTHRVVLFPSDHIATVDGGRWHMPNDSAPLVLTRSEPWTRAELDAEHERQSRLRRWQRLAA